jgi:hypothetical protein
VWSLRAIVIEPVGANFPAFGIWTVPDPSDVAALEAVGLLASDWQPPLTAKQMSTMRSGCTPRSDRSPARVLPDAARESIVIF